MEITAVELDLMALMVAKQYAKLQAQAPVDVFLLGGALRIIKDALPSGEYEAFVKDRLPFGMRVARRIIEQGGDYLINKLAADAAAESEEN